MDIGFQNISNFAKSWLHFPPPTKLLPPNNKLKAMLSYRSPLTALVVAAMSSSFILESAVAGSTRQRLMQQSPPGAGSYWSIYNTTIGGANDRCNVAVGSPVSVNCCLGATEPLVPHSSSQGTCFAGPVGTSFSGCIGDGIAQYGEDCTGGDFMAADANECGCGFQMQGSGCFKSNDLPGQQWFVYLDGKNACAGTTSTGGGSSTGPPPAPTSTATTPTMDDDAAMPPTDSTTDDDAVPATAPTTDDDAAPPTASTMNDDAMMPATAPTTMEDSAPPVMAPSTTDDAVPPLTVFAPVTAPTTMDSASPVPAPTTTMDDSAPPVMASTKDDSPAPVNSTSTGGTIPKISPIMSSSTSSAAATTFSTAIVVTSSMMIAAFVAVSSVM
jgi:hypothetical protein